jgi:hypothetical protein
MLDRSIIMGLSSRVRNGDEMITKELKQQILSLSSDEQHEIVRLVQAQTNSWSGITKTPGVVGGDACIRNIRVGVVFLWWIDQPCLFKRDIENG